MSFLNPQKSCSKGQGQSNTPLWSPVHSTDPNNSREGCDRSRFADLLPKAYGPSTILSSKN